MPQNLRPLVWPFIGAAAAIFWVYARIEKPPEVAQNDVARALGDFLPVAVKSPLATADGASPTTEVEIIKRKLLRLSVIAFSPQAHAMLEQGDGSGAKIFRLQGSAFDRQSQSRKIILHFWASWCASCVAEHRMWSKIAGQLGSDALLLAVAVDDPAAMAMAKSLNHPQIFYVSFTQPASNFDDSLTKDLNVQSLPQTFFFHESGKLLSRLQRPIDEEHVAAIMRWIQER